MIDPADDRAAAFSRFAWFVLALNLAVIVWGGFVRASGSGAGCGAHWPLCNGVVVPQDPKIETLIELGHRVTSGLALIAVVALGVWTRRRFPGSSTSERSLRRLAGLAVLLIFAEAALGAGLVLLQYVGENSSAARAAWMAGHLVSTFLLLATLALLAERSRVDPAGANFSASPVGGSEATSRGQRRLEILSLVALLLTAMTGAIAALGDTLFPASTLAEGLAQDLSPTAHFLIQLRLLHPLVAIGAGVLCVLLAQRIRAGGTSGARSSRVHLWALWTIGLVAAQFAVGLLTLALLAPIWLQLVHLLAADLVWIAGVLMVDAARRTAGSGLSPN